MHVRQWIDCATGARGIIIGIMYLTSAKKKTKF